MQLGDGAHLQRIGNHHSFDRGAISFTTAKVFPVASTTTSVFLRNHLTTRPARRPGEAV